MEEEGEIRRTEGQIAEEVGNDAEDKLKMDLEQNDKRRNRREASERRDQRRRRREAARLENKKKEQEHQAMKKEDKKGGKNRDRREAIERRDQRQRRREAARREREKQKHEPQVIEEADEFRNIERRTEEKQERKNPHEMYQLKRQISEERELTRSEQEQSIQPSNPTDLQTRTRLMTGQHEERTPSREEASRSAPDDGAENDSEDEFSKIEWRTEEEQERENPREMFRMSRQISAERELVRTEREQGVQPPNLTGLQKRMRLMISQQEERKRRREDARRSS
ncbi:hypothetical protein MMC29_006209 [Sticta canariensis]|nr:hypothetical protein [Sticta canariensis]